MRRLIAISLLCIVATPAFTQQQPQQPTREQRNLYFLFPYGDRLTVKSLNGKAVSSPDMVLTFVEGAMRLNGFGGCNVVNADFRAGFNDLRFGPLNFTTNKCNAAVDATEIAVFKALQGAANWKPAGYRTIAITGRSGTVVLGPAF